MATYRSNSPENIREVFSKEGDSLSKAGFKEPNLSKKPEEMPTMHKVPKRIPIPAEADAWLMEQSTYVQTFGITQEQGEQ